MKNIGSFLGNSSLGKTKIAIKALFPETKYKRHKIEHLANIWDQVARGMGYQGYTTDVFAEQYIKYFCSRREEFYPALSTNPNKGLLSMGDVGGGKTLNFKIYDTIYSKIQIDIDGKIFSPLGSVNDDKFMICHVKEILSKVRVEGELYIEKLSKVKQLVLDDLGDENDDFKDWGTTRNPIIDIISHRYNRMYSGGLITHFTSNKNAGELKKRYGDRVTDRLREMTIQIDVKGKSKRV
jgi:DNA replication protein DnaC